jgi:hypothetical protein
MGKRRGKQRVEEKEMGKLKVRGKKPERHVITKLYMENGRVVTDPAEIQRLLKKDGFEIDDLTGKVTVGPKLIPQ